MLLNAIIVILKEVLEAALLVSLLSSVCRPMNIRLYWLVAAIPAGLIGAVLYATNLSTITELFEYTGQEITSVFIKVLIFFCFTWFIVSAKQNLNIPKYPLTKVIFQLILPVVLAITLEGSEIYIYLNGFMQSNQQISPMLMGSTIGLCIGTSIGTLIYFGLVNCKLSARFLIVKLTLAVIATGILSQSAALLLQIDVLSSKKALWDTSFILNEDSITGQLLHSTIGYEATPAPQQFAIYVCGFVIIAAWSLLNRRLTKLRTLT